MKHEALFQGDAGKLRLEITGRENLHATNDDDANWLRAILDITAGPFSGTVEIGITAWEIARLRHELETTLETLTGSLHFPTMEDNWTLDLIVERSGAILVKGKVTQNPAGWTKLHYEFHTDPITIESAVRDLRRMIDAYPVLHIGCIL